jgi:hypothetical protein
MCQADLQVRAMNSLDVTGDQFHPDWNYTIRPRPS